MTARLVLASTSVSRQALLRGAGIDFDVVAPHVDEEAIRLSMQQAGETPRAMADALAQAKAVKVSLRCPGALVLGCDQMLSYGDNLTLDKPCDMDEARRHLQTLQGRDHCLIGAAVMALDGKPVWRVIDTATLTMRSLGAGFIDWYLATEGEAVLACVGAYRLEALGSQLFSRIAGDYFTILGLPLLPVLHYLRDRKVIAA
jgi:septum formation protein